MFSTVRGKECGSTTKSKKDIGVSATDRGGETLQDGAWLLLTTKPNISASRGRTGSLLWACEQTRPFWGQFGKSIKTRHGSWPPSPRKAALKIFAPMDKGRPSSLLQLTGSEGL